MDHTTHIQIIHRCTDTHISIQIHVEQIEIGTFQKIHTLMYNNDTNVHIINFWTYVLNSQ